MSFALFELGCGPAGPTAAASGDTGRTDWPMYRGDAAGTGYSSLTQITPDNVADLDTAWTYSLYAAGTGGPGQPGGSDPRSQATPIVVDGRMYLPAQDRVVALDPVTGREIWRHMVEEGAPSRRGVAYWASQAPRVIFAVGSDLVALDASTGRPAEEFGDGGVVDMGIPYNSVPLVFEDVVVVGANTPRGQIGGVGNARAFDARTGAKLWEFSSVSQPGQPGHETWEGESWRGRLGANAWPFYFTVDEERGLVYLPLAAPIPFWYGGDRPGDNLFANSLVAVDVRTGEYAWHFQTIHHGLWDHDPPAPPVLFDIPGGDLRAAEDVGVEDQAGDDDIARGETIPALAVTTKSGYLYILNRETGRPIFGVEERPAPRSDVPGERTSPTQPIPIEPPPLARVGYGSGDLVTGDITSPEHAEACRRLVERSGEVVNRGPFTPWVYRPPGSAPRATLLFPGLVGGPNWGGVAYDPASEFLFVFSQDLGSLGWLEDAEEGSPVPYDRAGPRPSSFDVEIGGQRLPCQMPPWGQLTAVESATGEIAWQRPLGVSEVLPEGRQNTGRPGRAGAIVTASGLVFIAATDDNRFRALDAETGRTLWDVELPGHGNADPMTFLGSDGRQYLVIAAEDRILAWTLGTT